LELVRSGSKVIIPDLDPVNNFGSTTLPRLISKTFNCTLFIGIGRVLVDMVMYGILVLLQYVGKK
jgi:hypothetical protein